ncbi:nucleic acid-binding/zinc ion-binding protein [Arabidopsis thaliana]|uniref:Nucleic acid-binding/zinc ion-binding protein n=1 Tax=Arabidopsis thaliana TaxID=3702 RepID=F4J925_ARATH|nr:nucleic acid-binding/zinc ion-binding protein [Arabidopsis thaliana]AEE77678.1 nucleic acid-binding/zinc ion-binding protein [Arabidopsis thaliana]|eukprot:NP_189737.1 nucleic acid-binding/zinc ion-binding protein [Arabidopsis thaliana]
MAEDSESTESTMSIESDPSECPENADDHDDLLSSEEANHVEWMITEDGELFAVPTENATEEQANEILNNMLSMFYVPSTDEEGSLGVLNLGTIGEHGLELEEANGDLFDVPVIQVDGAFGEMNEYGANNEYEMLMLTGIDEENENGAIENEIENELEHAIDQLIAKCAQDYVPNGSQAILMITNPSEVDSCWENEMFKGNEPSDDEGNGRSKGKMIDKAGEDERQKGKRAAELEMELEKAKDQRIIGVNPHSLGIGYGINSKVKPRIRATARKSVGRKLATPAKRPCDICGHTDHLTEDCLYSSPTMPYMDNYTKCYCCRGLGHVSMYCPYVAPNAGERSLRGVGPLMTAGAEEKCLNEGMPSFLWVRQLYNYDKEVGNGQRARTGKYGQEWAQMGKDGRVVANYQPWSRSQLSLGAEVGVTPVAICHHAIVRRHLSPVGAAAFRTCGSGRKAFPNLVKFALGRGNSVRDLRIIACGRENLTMSKESSTVLEKLCPKPKKLSELSNP